MILSTIGKLVGGVLAGSAIITPAVLLSAPPKFDLKTDNKFKNNCQLFDKDKTGQKQLIVCSFDDSGNSPIFYFYKEGNIPVQVWKLKKLETNFKEVELELGTEEHSRQSVKMDISIPSKWTELSEVNVGNCDFADNTSRVSEKWKISCEKTDKSLPKKEIELTPLFSR